MRQYRTSAIILVIVFFAFIYFFIPNKIIVTGEYIIPQTGNSVIRGLMKTQSWNKWVPAKSIEGNSFILTEGKLEVIESLVSTVQTNFTIGDFNTPVSFSAVAIGQDSSLLKFEAVVDNRHISPIQRIQDYWISKKVKSQMNKVLDAAVKNYSTTNGIYGFNIIEDHVKDSVLVTTHKTFTDTPNLVQLYEMIHLLETHIQKNTGIIHGAPMVNITRLGVQEVFAQVAFPLANTIPEAANLEIKKMVLGNILTVKVLGDNKEVAHAFDETKNYLHDKLKMSPAMPFIVYNTNRLLEKDAKKWVSTIYYPVY